MGKQNERKPAFALGENAKLVIIIIAILAGTFVLVRLINSDSVGDTPNDEVPTGDAQSIIMSVAGRGYTPNSFTVDAGKPVRWVITVGSGAGCASYLVAKDFGISQQLNPGKNVLTFTPQQKGTFQFTCGMGMYKGTINVV